MGSSWNPKDLFLLARKLTDLRPIGYTEAMSMRLSCGEEMSCAEEGGKQVRLGCVWSYKEEEPKIRLKLCLIEMCLKRHPEDAVDRLLLFSRGGSESDLAVIFMAFHKLATKYGVYDGRVLRECKAHLNTVHLRDVIRKTLAEYSLRGASLVLKELTEQEAIEMNLVNPRNLDPSDPGSQDVARTLLSTINKDSFKHTRRIIREIDGRLFAYLPEELNATGYLHIRDLFRGLSASRASSIAEAVGCGSVVRLFLPQKVDDVHRFFIHKDVDVRIESLRHVDTLCLARKFLEVNQFIYSRSMVRLARDYFCLLLSTGCWRKTEVEEMYSEVVLPMLRSRNVARRLLGAHLMDLLVSKCGVELSECGRMLFDSDHEIRGIAGRHSSGISLDADEVVVRLESHQSHDVDGCVEYVKRLRSKDLADRAKKIFRKHIESLRSGRKKIEEVPLHGFLDLFAELADYEVGEEVDLVYDHCFQRLKDATREHEDAGLVVYWKNLKGCCHYYCCAVLSGKKDLSSKLVQVLLHVDHLGVILQAVQYFGTVLRDVIFEEDEVAGMLELAFSRIRRCKTVFRRSGGIPLLFVRILKTYPAIFDRVLERLFELVEAGDDDTKVHCLNVISRIVGDGCLIGIPSLQVVGLFRLAFRCSRASCWPVRNVGTEIFSHLVRKVFGKQYECIDACIMAYSGLRELVSEELASCCHGGNDVLTFLVLHVYGRMQDLAGKEMEALGALSARGGIIGLKARNACSRRRWRGPGRIDMRMRFSPKTCEGEALVRVFTLLDSEHFEERDMAEAYLRDVYKLPLYSPEYLKHWLARRICSIGYQDVATQEFERYSSCVEESLSRFFNDSPSNERFDLKHTISLIAKYKA